MYALKARDKLHKREKERYEKDKSPKAGKRGGERSRDRDSRPTTVRREAKYVGTFYLDMSGGWKKDFGKPVKQQLSRVNTKDPSNALMPVCLQISMEGIKVLSPDGRDLIMAHALKRIVYCTCDSKKHLFAIVARNPQEGSEGVYTHVFVTAKKDQANELNQIVSKAFRVHFASKSLERERKSIASQSSNPELRSPVPPYNPAVQLQPQTNSSSQAPPPYNPEVPWTVASSGSQQRQQQSRPLSGGVGGGGGRNSWTAQQPVIGPSPPVAPSHQKSKSELIQEAGVLETQIATIQTRLREIQYQMTELAGIEDAIVQLTVQTSRLQAQLDEKQRQLSSVQFQIQDRTLQEQAFLQPPSIPGYSASPVVSPRTSRSDLLPDFQSLSLEDADWFHEGIPRDIAMEILSQQPEGAFMVRQSTSNPGSYALSMKAPNNKILHYLIENISGGFRLQGSVLTYPSIVELVYNYSVNKDNLPCALNLSSSNPAFLEGDGARGGSDSDDDDDYLGVGQYRLIT